MPTFNPILGRPSRGVKKDDALLNSVNRRTQGMTEKIEALMGRVDALAERVSYMESDLADQTDALEARIEALEKKVNKPKKGDIKGRLDALEADR